MFTAYMSDAASQGLEVAQLVKVLRETCLFLEKAEDMRDGPSLRNNKDENTQPSEQDLMLAHEKMASVRSQLEAISNQADLDTSLSVLLKQFLIYCDPETMKFFLRTISYQADEFLEKLLHQRFPFEDAQAALNINLISDCYRQVKIDFLSRKLSALLTVQPVEQTVFLGMLHSVTLVKFLEYLDIFLMKSTVSAKDKILEMSVWHIHQIAQCTEALVQVGGALTDQNVYRLLLGVVFYCVKLVIDRRPSLADYAESTGLSVDDVKALERAAMHVMLAATQSQDVATGDQYTCNVWHQRICQHFYDEMFQAWGHSKKIEDFWTIRLFLAACLTNKKMVCKEEQPDHRQEASFYAHFFGMQEMAFYANALHVESESSTAELLLPSEIKHLAKNVSSDACLNAILPPPGGYDPRLFGQRVGVWVIQTVTPALPSVVNR